MTSSSTSQPQRRALGTLSGGIAIGDRWPSGGRVAATSPSPTSNQSDLSIESPGNGGSAKLATDIVIHTPILKPGQHVWVQISFYLEPQIYPEGECAMLGKQQYVCRAVEFGDKDTKKNTLFNISAVIVDDHGDSTYQRFRSSGFPNGNPPVSVIAESSQITVRRI
jgi:hypothetical protein